MAQQSGGQPAIVLKEGTERTTGREARRINILVARIIAEALKTTLGPKGMDKMLVDSIGDAVITNDGATILKKMDIEHPVGKMMVDIAKTQEDEAGDGTTTAVVITGELLKCAEDLLEQDVHPTIIASGYRLAAEKAKKILDDMSHEISIEDIDSLKNVAVMAMTGKVAEKVKNDLSELIVKAVETIAEEDNGKVIIDVDNIKIEKKEGGSIKDTELIQGVVIDKERVHPGMPTKISNAKIALLNAPIEIEKTEVNAKINITDPSQLQAFINEEERMIKTMVEQIKESGATVLFCQKGIDDLAQHYLAKEGIFAVRRVKKGDIEKLSRATGATIVTNLEDISEKDLGYAGIVKEMKIGDDGMVFTKECKKPKAVTILVRGGTKHIVDEIERVIDDSLGVVISAIRYRKVIAGAGASEVETARGIREYAKSIGGREQLAIEAFADALEVIPRALAENAGLDPIDTLVELRTKHEENRDIGYNVMTKRLENVIESGLITPTNVKIQAIDSASEVAVMILRIDDVIAASSLGKGGA